MLLLLILLSLLELARAATVILITPSNDSLPFEARESAFTPGIRQMGLIGTLYTSNPIDACQPLKERPSSASPAFVLARRGECTFEVKVRHAQDAGFGATIVFNNEDNRDLVIMTGDAAGITIPAVFVSREAGFVLTKYAGDEESLCYLLPAMEYPAWSVMAVAFISLVAVTGVLATFFFVRRHRLRSLGSRLLLTRNADTLSSKEVKALPTLIFRRLDEATSPESCVICMEEYEEGQKLRILPCRHAFHAICVDQWLTTRKRFCPVCKRDAQSVIDTENTPLLPQTTTEAIQPPTQAMQNGSQSSSTGCLPIQVPSRGSPSSSSSSSTFFQQHQVNTSHGSSCPPRLSRVPSSNPRSRDSSNSSWPRSSRLLQA